MADRLDKFFAEMRTRKENDPSGLWAAAERAKRTAAEERNKPAVPVQYIPAFMFMMQAMNHRKEAKEEEEAQTDSSKKAKPLIRQTYVGQDAYFSSTPIARLKPTYLQDMKMRQRHKGKYLLCRVIAPVNRFVGLSIGVEDPRGWSQLLSLYNYPGCYNASTDELDTLFPLNSVIAIREPLVKKALGGNVDHSHIRVDSPTDIFIIQDPVDPLLRGVKWDTGSRPIPVLTKTANEWKAVGDSHFRKAQFYAAIAAYSYSIQRNPTQFVVKLNRSLANLRAERYIPAIDDADAALGLIANVKGNNNRDQAKAHYRRGQAFYGLQEYKSAKEAYLACLSFDPTLKEASSALVKCDTRMKEASTGIYDWDLLGQLDLPDIADYIGPVEKIALPHRGGGRGVVASRDIKCGELLVVAKSFAAAVIVDESEWIMGFNFLTNRVEDEASHVLRQKVFAKLASNPHAAKEFLDLYAGPTFPPNAGDSGSELLYIDSGRIEGICSFNSFGHRSPASSQKTGNLKEIQDRSSLVYTFASYFNHACHPNTERGGHEHGYGDVMVIRAATDVTKGEELTLRYCSPMESYAVRKDHLSKWFPECDCSLCKGDRACTPAMLGERERLIGLVTQPTGGGKKSIDQLRKLTRDIDKTYPLAYGPFRPASAIAHQTLAQVLDKATTARIKQRGMTDVDAHRLNEESIKEGFAAFEALGVQILDNGLHALGKRQENRLPISTKRLPFASITLTECSFHMIGRFMAHGDMKRAGMWLRAAFWFDSNWHNGTLEGFKKRWASWFPIMNGHAEALLNSIEEKAH